MGLEDYGVILKPKPVKRPALDAATSTGPRATVAAAVTTLQQMGFARQPAPAQLAGTLTPPHADRETRKSAAPPPALPNLPSTSAHADRDTRKSAAPPPALPNLPSTSAHADRDTRLTATLPVDAGDPAGTEGGQYIVEAHVRRRERAPGGTDLESLSLRFAVCQPEGAGFGFLQIVRRLCDTLSLAVVLGDRTYDSDVFWAFRLYANEQIRSQEDAWRRMFEQDSEQLPIAVEDMWRHFLAKHPGLLETGDPADAADATPSAATPAQRAQSGPNDTPGGTNPPADALEAEETLPPGAARALAEQAADRKPSLREQR